MEGRVGKGCGGRQLVDRRGKEAGRRLTLSGEVLVRDRKHSGPERAREAGPAPRAAAVRGAASAAEADVRTGIGIGIGGDIWEPAISV